MSIIEKNALLRTSDSEGNGSILYPVTRLECVIGLEERLENFVTNVAYLDLTLGCVPASTNVALAGITVKDTAGNTVFAGVYGSATPKRIEVTTDTSYTVSFTNPTGFSLGGDSFTFTATNELRKVYEFSENFYALYGFVIDEDEADPFERVSYINDNANFTPVTVDVAGDGNADENDWASFIETLVTPMKIDNNGVILTELNRTNTKYSVAGVEETYSDNQHAMVRFRKLWCRKNNDTKTFEYSFVEFPGSTCWTWANGENTRADYIYYPMYKGSINAATGAIKSVPYATLLSSTTIQEEIAACEVNGDGWYFRTHLMQNLLEEMTWLLGKSTDCQNTFGEGYTDSSNVQMLDTGSTIESGAFWGSSNSNKDVKFLYIEGAWGNRWDHITGMFCSVEELCDVWVKPYPPFNLTGEGYIKQPSNIPYTRNYGSKLAISDIGNHFTDNTGSSTTHYCDYIYSPLESGIIMPFTGGNSKTDVTSGVSSWLCSIFHDEKNDFRSASAHFIPPPTE